MSYTLTVAVKPHIAKFLEAYGQEHSLKNDRRVIKQLFEDLTDDPLRRMQTVPKGMVKMELEVSAPYKNKWVDRERVRQVATTFDNLFFDTAEKEVSKKIVNHKTAISKDAAIHAFLSKYGITESLYSIGNMRRLMHRRNVFGSKSGTTGTEKRISYKLTNSQCHKLVKMVKSGLSTRQVGRYFEIDNSQVYRIAKKIA